MWPTPIRGKIGDVTHAGRMFYFDLLKFQYVGLDMKFYSFKLDFSKSRPSSNRTQLWQCIPPTQDFSNEPRIQIL